MRIKDTPERWNNKIKEYLKEKGSQYNSLSIADFDSDKQVEIKFADGSYAVFKYPLIIEAPEMEEIGIFTEHCGYFFFHQEAIEYELNPLSLK